MVKMSEICIRIPEDIPVTILKRKIDEVIKEEELRWALFEKCKNELSLSKKEFEALEIAREEAWKETKKRYGL